MRGRRSRSAQRLDALGQTRGVDDEHGDSPDRRCRGCGANRGGRRDRVRATCARGPGIRPELLRLPQPERDYLNQSGVPFENRTDAILTAKQCRLDMSRQGGTTDQAANNLVKQEGWTQSEAQTLVQAAVPT